MSNRRLAVVSVAFACVLVVAGVIVAVSIGDDERESPIQAILDACVGGDDGSCYSFAGLQMGTERGMALAALEMCASDRRAISRFDCMYKLAMAHQTGRAGQRNFVLAHRWYASLIAERGPRALVDVARGKLRSLELLMSRTDIAVARAQTESWLGHPEGFEFDSVPVNLETRL